MCKTTAHRLDMQVVIIWLSVLIIAQAQAKRQSKVTQTAAAWRSANTTQVELPPLETCIHAETVDFKFTMESQSFFSEPDKGALPDYDMEKIQYRSLLVDKRTHSAMYFTGCEKVEEGDDCKVILSQKKQCKTNYYTFTYMVNSTGLQALRFVVDGRVQNTTLPHGDVNTDKLQYKGKTTHIMFDRFKDLENNAVKSMKINVTLHVCCQVKLRPPTPQPTTTKPALNTILFDQPTGPIADVAPAFPDVILNCGADFTILSETFVAAYNKPFPRPVPAGASNNEPKTYIQSLGCRLGNAFPFLCELEMHAKRGCKAKSRFFVALSVADVTAVKFFEGPREKTQLFAGERESFSEFVEATGARIVVQFEIKKPKSFNIRLDVKFCCQNQNPQITDGTHDVGGSGGSGAPDGSGGLGIVEDMQGEMNSNRRCVAQLTKKLLYTRNQPENHDILKLFPELNIERNDQLTSIIVMPQYENATGKLSILISGFMSNITCNDSSRIALHVDQLTHYGDSALEIYDPTGKPLLQQGKLTFPNSTVYHILVENPEMEIVSTWDKKAEQHFIYASVSICCLRGGHEGDGVVQSHGSTQQPGSSYGEDGITGGTNGNGAGTGSCANPKRYSILMAEDNNFEGNSAPHELIHHNDVACSPKDKECHTLRDLARNHYDLQCDVNHKTCILKINFKEHCKKLNGIDILPGSPTWRIENFTIMETGITRVHVSTDKISQQVSHDKNSAKNLTLSGDHVHVFQIGVTKKISISYTMEKARVYSIKIRLDACCEVAANEFRQDVSKSS